MTLPPAALRRQLKHRRQIDVQVFSRGDGLWEVDALLTDLKTRAAHLVDGPRPAGTPIHEMLLRLGGVLGCTHLTELAQVLLTAVVQAFAGEVVDTRGSAEGANQPFQIDRCQALRGDGEVVRLHYPRGHRPAAAAPSGHTTSD